MSLQQLQIDFQDYMLKQPLEQEAAIIANIADPICGNRKARLDIYGDAYAIRLVEVLAADFPKLAAFMGEAEFQKLAETYTHANPSKDFSVNNFGTKLSEFIAATKPYSEKPILHELAQFEWSFGLRFESADAKAVTIAELQQLPQASWPQMRFRFHPSLDVLTFNWNVAQIWQALELKHKIPKARKLKKPQPTLLWRHQITAYYEAISKEEHLILQELRQNKTFAEVCEALCQYMPEAKVAQYTAEILMKWLQQELIIEVIVPEFNS